MNIKHRDNYFKNKEVILNYFMKMKKANILKKGEYITS